MSGDVNIIISSNAKYQTRNTQIRESCIQQVIDHENNKVSDQRARGQCYGRLLK